MFWLVHVTFLFEQLYYTVYRVHVYVCQLESQDSDGALLLELVNLLLDVIEKVHVHYFCFFFPHVFFFAT